MSGPSGGNTISRELNRRYRERLDSAERAEQARRINESNFSRLFAEWCSHLGTGVTTDQIDAVRHEAHTEFDSNIETGTVASDDVIDGLSDRFEIAMVRALAMERGRQAFDATFDAWVTRAAEVKRQAEPGNELFAQFDLPVDVLDRMRTDMRTEFEKRLKPEVEQTFATISDVRSDAAQHTEQAYQRLADLLGDVTADLDLRAGFEAAMLETGREFDRIIGDWRESLDDRRRALMDTWERSVNLSSAGTSLLRAEYDNQVRREFLSVFGSNSSVKDLLGTRVPAHDQSETPETPETETPENLGDLRANLSEWRQRCAARRESLLDDIVYQSIRETGLTMAVDAVDEAAKDWRGGLGQYGADLASAFGLSDAKLSRQQVQRVKLEIGADVDAAYSDWRDAGAKDPQTLLSAVDGLTGADRIREHLAVALARQVALTRARADARERIGQWRAERADGRSLADDSEGRVVSGFRDRVEKAFDSAFQTAADQDIDPADQLRRWNDAYTELRDELAMHLAFESEATEALTRAEAGFTDMVGDRILDEAESRRIGEEYRTDWFDAYRRLWAPENLDGDAWLSYQPGDENVSVDTTQSLGHAPLAIMSEQQPSSAQPETHDDVAHLTPERMDVLSAVDSLPGVVTGIRDCVVRLDALHRRLYGGGVGGPVDDSVVGLSPERGFAERLGTVWSPVDDLATVERWVRDNPGWTAFVLGHTPGGDGHGIALHHDRTLGPVVVETQATGDARILRIANDGRFPLDGLPVSQRRVIVVNETGHPVNLGLTTHHTSATSIDALTDPGNTHDHGMKAEQKDDLSASLPVIDPTEFRTITERYLAADASAQLTTVEQVQSADYANGLIPMDSQGMRVHIQDLADQSANMSREDVEKKREHLRKANIRWSHESLSGRRLSVGPVPDVDRHTGPRVG